ncbi:hypothetical protein R1flu_007874 [Riccia fluitans]|uniref:Protein kinase domain-containing protein n=1 Tax=Riccia fluitans TaxID=41844 RepID=A0ABD1Z027_9MARC
MNRASDQWRLVTSVLLFFSVLTCAREIVDGGRPQFDIPTANFTLGGVDGSPFKCNERGNLWCGGNASTSSPSAQGALTLTPTNRNQSHEFYYNTYGMALYTVPIQLLDVKRNRWHGFSTYFKFTIEPADQRFPGDGMAFVVLNVSQWPGSPGGAFGVYDGNGQQLVKTLAIEFDTYRNLDFGDISNNHVGVDLDNLTSKASRDASDVGITLYGGEPIHAWIDFDAESNKLEVRINRNHTRPVLSFLNYSGLFLYDVFDDSGPVYVGFSGSNGLCECHNFYTIYEWGFTVLHMPNNEKEDFLIGFIVGTVILVVLSTVLICLCVWERIYASDTERFEYVEDLVGIADSLRFSYKQLSIATNKFREDSKLGEGGFGCVYRGVMPKSKQPVAVKRVSNDSKQGRREFVAEVSIISQLRHRNIVRLLGWCSDKDKLLLVYELMPNGSLDKALFHEEKTVLSWEHRFRIIRGLAAALQYLHEGWRQQIIHRDIKSSNVMLDQDYNAMLGDFGLARMVDRHQNPATTMVAGTFGYIAPEVPVTGRFTDKTDVYAFGAVALEVACGRVAFDQWLAADETVLVNWVWSRLAEGRLLSVVDQRLEDNYDKKEAELLLLLGLLCSHPNPNDRPSMRHVVDILGEVVPMPDVPSSKPAFPYHQIALHYRMEGLLNSSPNLSSIGSRFEDNNFFTPHDNASLSTPDAPDEKEPLLPRSNTPLGGISGNVTLVRLIRNFFRH